MKALTSTIIFICLAVSLHGQDKALQDAGTKALGDLKALAAMQDIKMPDMPSPEMLANARLGEMLPHSMIKLDRLQQYASGSDPRPLIEKLDRVTFPVLGSTAEVLSSVEVERSMDTWRTADLNNAAYVKAFEMVRKENNLVTSKCMLIRVPAFNLYFLGTETSRGLELALLADKGFSNVPPKRLTPATEVMTQLNVIAKNYNGLPW